MDGDERLILLVLMINLTWPKCIKLPTFFVYDRLNVPDLIHFSGTDFTRLL